MSAVGATALAGVALLAVAVVVATRPRRVGVGALLSAVGLVMTGVAGAIVLIGGASVGSGFGDVIDPAFGIDRLSGFFLLTLALAGAPALVFARDYLDRDLRGAAIAALSAMFLLCLIGLITARDPSTLLGFWELITLVPAVAILVRNSDAQVRSAVYVYLAVTHIGGVGVWISVLVLADAGALSDPGSLAEQGAWLQALVICAAIVGFGTKAGLMPMHAWLPRAHPVAPAFLSALMSGVMIKVAIYGLIRVLFEWAAPAPAWSGVALLAIGLLSCLAGVVYALLQRELKRLLAFSSIENVGIVALGLGASIVLAAEGEDGWAAIAFAAALFQILNHAVFKSLLFLGAGAIERATGGLDLDRLGGLLSRMPWSGGAFLVGAMAIAGLPPLNGFASEWVTLQALVHLGIQGPAGFGVAGALAMAGLAATAALALYCFVKVAGLVLLGNPRRTEVASATEPPVGIRSALVFLAGACLTLGLLSGLLVPLLAELAPTPVSLAPGAALDLPGTGGLSPALAAGLLLLVPMLWWARGNHRAASAPAWACGQPPEPEQRWGSAGFTKPPRLVLEAVLRPDRDLTVTRRDGLIESVSYSDEIPHLFDTVVYAPVQRGSLRLATLARRLQSGSVRTYAAYLLGLLLSALLLLRMGVFG